MLGLNQFYSDENNVLHGFQAFIVATWQTGGLNRLYEFGYLGKIMFFLKEIYKVWLSDPIMIT